SLRFAERQRCAGGGAQKQHRLFRLSRIATSFAPMRKLLVLLAVLAVIHIGFLFVRPSGASAARVQSDLNVGIVFDVGGRGDKSFNDGAYVGGMRAERQLNAHVRFIEPGDGSDRESGLRLLAAEGMDLVIGVGFIFTD